MGGATALGRPALPSLGGFADSDEAKNPKGSGAGSL